MYKIITFFYVILYYLLSKRAEKSLDKQWAKVSEILHKLWNLREVGTKEVIAHCIPTHKFVWYHISQPWWEFRINKYDAELVFSFDWLYGEPSPIINRELGEALYKEEQHANCAFDRLEIILKVFYEAMKRALAKPINNKVVCFNKWLEASNKLDKWIEKSHERDTPKSPVYLKLRYYRKINCGRRWSKSNAKFCEGMYKPRERFAPWIIDVDKDWCDNE